MCYQNYKFAKQSTIGTIYQVITDDAFRSLACLLGLGLGVGESMPEKDRLGWKKRLSWKRENWRNILHLLSYT